jgi:hypothetical protein
MERRLFETIGASERDHFKTLLEQIAEQAGKLEEGQQPQ